MLEIVSKSNRPLILNFIQQEKPGTASEFFGTSRLNIRQRGENGTLFNDDGSTLNWLISKAFSFAKDIVEMLMPTLTSAKSSVSTSGERTSSNFNQYVVDSLCDFIGSAFDAYDDKDTDKDNYWYSFF